MKIGKVNILDIASFVLLHCIKNEISISHLKLQKLLYYIQAWHLVYFSKNQIFDEVPEAWVNGPVYRSVYNKFKDFQMYNRLEYKKDKLDKLESEYKDSIDKLNVLSKNQIEFLNAVIGNYATMSHDKLVLLTHSEDPWNKARKDCKPFEYSNNQISIDDMFEFYSSKLNQKSIS